MEELRAIHNYERYPELVSGSYMLSGGNIVDIA
jgi:hypothetical protein